MTIHSSKVFGARRITKGEAISLFKNRAALARALGLSPGAITHWPEDKPIPFEHEQMLRWFICPENFRKKDRPTPERLVLFMAGKTETKGNGRIQWKAPAAEQASIR